MSARLSIEVPRRVVRSGCWCCRSPSTTFCQPRTFEFFSLQHVKLWSTCVLFRRSLRLELTSWAYPTININSCLQALTKDISTPADIAPSALETIIFYWFMVRDQPNSRRKMRDFTKCFWQYAQFHRKFTEGVSGIHGKFMGPTDVISRCYKEASGLI